MRDNVNKRQPDFVIDPKLASNLNRKKNQQHCTEYNDQSLITYAYF